MALFDNADKVTRMRVPSREGRLTGNESHRLQRSQVASLSSRENRKISGSPPGQPRPASFPSDGLIPEQYCPGNRVIKILESGIQTTS